LGADAPDTPAELKARALRYLVRREHSRAELARKLAPHAETAQAVEAVLDLLLSKKQQSDVRFAEERVRTLSRKFGAAKICHDLKAKGIDRQLIAALSFGDELERAKAVLVRRYREPPATREESAKRARFLMSRGFSHDIIRRALSSIDAE
jgi:regulatory protein